MRSACHGVMRRWWSLRELETVPFPPVKQTSPSKRGSLQAMERGVSNAALPYAAASKHWLDRGGCIAGGTNVVAGLKDDSVAIGHGKWAIKCWLRHPFDAAGAGRCPAPPRHAPEGWVLASRAVYYNASYEACSFDPNHVPRLYMHASSLHRRRLSF